MKIGLENIFDELTQSTIILSENNTSGRAGALKIISKKYGVLVTDYQFDICFILL